MSEKSLTGYAVEEGLYTLTSISTIIAICQAVCVNPHRPALQLLVTPPEKY
jgi:hypothetical protein